MLFCLDPPPTEYQVPSNWTGISAPSLLTLCPTHNLSKVHTRLICEHFCFYIPDILTSTSGLFLFTRNILLKKSVQFMSSLKETKWTMVQYTNGDVTFLRFFLCSPASKRHSMTSTLATVKTFKGPDGSGPDYWVFLSRASKGKFSMLPLSLLIHSSLHILLIVAAALATCVHIQCVF